MYLFQKNYYDMLPDISFCFSILFPSNSLLYAAITKFDFRSYDLRVGRKLILLMIKIRLKIVCDYY